MYTLCHVMYALWHAVRGVPLRLLIRYHVGYQEEQTIVFSKILVLTSSQFKLAPWVGEPQAQTGGSSLNLLYP